MAAPAQLRGVPEFPLTGIKAIECESARTFTWRLRTYELNSAGTPTDTGGLILQAWDPDNQVIADGGGYFCDFRNASGTLLAQPSVTQLGVRSIITGQFTGLPSNTETFTVTYPDLRDETVDPPPSITRTYRWMTTPTQANDLKIGATAQACRDTLLRALNGTSDYGDHDVYHGTLACLELYAQASSTDTYYLAARDGGTWGNGCTIDTSSVTNMGPGAANLAGGTGIRGIRLDITDTDFPNTLITSGQRSITGYYDVFGRDASGVQTKLVTGHATLYRSETEKP